MKRFFGAAGVAIAFSIVSQVAVKAEDVEIEKIVVTPSRIEQSYGETARQVDVVTSKEIQSYQSTDIADPLDKLSSVDMSQYGGPGANKTIRMRGSTAAQVLVMVDGIPINSPRDGEADIARIPMDNIERVEVMHGPASSLYGAGAMGGAVNIITKEPPKDKPKTELYSGFGTKHTYNERLTHGARIRDFSYLISGDYQSSNGFRPNSQFNAKDFNTKFEYQLNSCNKVKLNTSFYKSLFGSPGSTEFPDPDDKQRNVKDLLSFSWEFKPDTDTAVSFSAYNSYDRLEFMENDQVSSFFETPYQKDIHTTKVWGEDLQFTRRFGSIYQAVAGFNYVRNANDSTASAKHEYTVRAGYLENQFDFTQKLKVTLGARVDGYSNFGTQLDPSFSVLYRFNDKYNVHSTVSRSFRAPTFNDLYWPNTGWAVGNPNLKPEKGATAEIGFDARPWSFISSSLTYYRSNYSDLINWMPDATGFVWSPQNIGSATIHGVEFSNTVYLPHNFEFDLGHTYLRAMDNKTHTFLIYQPRYKADMGFKYKDQNGLQAGVTFQFTGNRYHSSDNTMKVKQYFVLSLNASKKFKNGLTYLFSIDNLTNRSYQVIRDYPMPGLAVTSGLKYEF
jgi:outer membrane cobalamin receptor